ncbi:single-stranded DNA-binding protein [Thiomonas bhubaneswarensis]|uniref:Single-stranded DNA-binding protein n=1 Tax=Thiomonas bhubaneswarensis TaxID=339866 RepID=A0A0K6I1F1_9BURK|nr:single-stranded DNA-binding protein [Thiomonas bhubaneswarensis]CUA96989.1 single-strand binding protein [Thiomonas bhubaneswarensis]
MSSLNKVQLIGHLGRDPEVRYTPDGLAVAHLQIATTRVWKDKNGERQEETEWTRVVFYDRRAEIASDYLKKGSQCFVEGYLRTRKWEDKGGVERFTPEVVGTDLILLGGKSGAQPQEQTQAQPEQAVAAPVAAARRPVDMSKATFTIKPDTEDI